MTNATKSCPTPSELKDRRLATATLVNRPRKARLVCRLESIEVCKALSYFARNESMTTHDCLLLVSELLMIANAEDRLPRAIKGAKVMSETFERGRDYPDAFLTGMALNRKELLITWYFPGKGHQTFHLSARGDF